MTPLQQSVDVIIERIPLVNRWASERWQPATVEIASHGDAGPNMREEVPGRCRVEPLGSAGNLWRCKGFEIELHPTEAEGYFLNITSPDPRIFVMWRFFEDVGEPRARPVLVTVSYNEAARFMDGGEQVDGVPMVPAINEWIRGFVNVHYKPEPRRKARRNDPLAAEGAENRGPRRR